MWKPAPPRVLAWLATAAWEIYSFLSIALFDGAGAFFAEALSAFVVICFCVGVFVRQIEDVATICLEVLVVAAIAAALSIVGAIIGGAYADERLTFIGFSVLTVWAGTYLVAALTAMIAGGLCSQSVLWLWRKMIRPA